MATCSHCPECRGPVQVWQDDSGGITVNFHCPNEACASGKPPWDTPRPLTSYEQAELDAWAEAKAEQARFKRGMRRMRGD